MMSLVYIFTMAIAFTSNFMGVNTNYYLRLGVGLLWIVIWVIRSKGVIQTNKFLRHLIIPWICIFALTLFLWVFNRPEYFDSSYVTRMFSNVLYCLVATLNAYIGLVFFGKKVIKLSFFALICSIAANFMSVWNIYGNANIITYLKNVFVQDYAYGSTMLDVSMDMEVQGATMALGLFFVYYLFFYNDGTKITKTLYILVSLLGLYIGFKRVVLLGVLLVVAILWILKSKKANVKNVILYAFIVFTILAFGYVVVVKTDLISLISMYFNVDMMGRTNIYRNASKLFEISPFYLGLGFGYAAKYMFDTTNFAVHSDIVRMYIELGFFPFFAWLWYYIYFVPQKVVDVIGSEAGKICIAATIFTFSTFLVENTLGLYPLQYGLTLFTIYKLFDDENNAELLEE